MTMFPLIVRSCRSGARHLLRPPPIYQYRPWLWAAPAAALILYESSSPAHCDAVETPPSTHFSVQAALDAKDEMRKVRLARFLRDLQDLVADEEEEEDDDAAKEEPHLSLHVSLNGIQVGQLTPSKAASLIKSLRQGARFNRDSILALAQQATAVLAQEPSLLDLSGHRLTIVGDLHGSIESLSQVLQLCQADLADPQHRLVFNGDFVDRGENSLEVLTTLLILKLAYPQSVILLRGNHEDELVSSAYGFLDELKTKYGKQGHLEIFREVSRLFAALPLGAHTEHVFVVHGGLPSAEFGLEDLRQISSEARSKLKTVIQPKTKEEELLSLALWNDPSPQDGSSPNARGMGILFGPDMARNFLQRHRLRTLIRSHEPVETGAKCLLCGDGLSVITVFSAACYPNGEGTNLGAILKVDEEGNCEPVTYSIGKSFFDSLSTYLTDQLSIFENYVFDKDEKKANLHRRDEDKIRSYITLHRQALEAYFRSIDDENGLISRYQWVTAMEDVLEIRVLPWLELQPHLAPATTRKNGQDLIDWRDFLLRNSSRQAVLHKHDTKIKVLQENHDKLMHIFRFMDLNGDGRINRKEFDYGVEILNTQLPADKQLSDPVAIFDAVDVDNDDEITLEEFRAFFKQSATFFSIANSLDDAKIETLHQNHDIIVAAFNFLDADGSGTINREEFATGIKLLNKRLPADSRFDDPDELFDLLDPDKHGEISIHEFNEIFQSASL